MKNKVMTKISILNKLFDDGYINVKTLWNLLALTFPKSEVEEIDKTFRQHKKDTK